LREDAGVWLMEQFALIRSGKRSGILPAKRGLGRYEWPPRERSE
jgi:hypothetical protein